MAASASLMINSVGSDKASLNCHRRLCGKGIRRRSLANMGISPPMIIAPGPVNAPESLYSYHQPIFANMVPFLMVVITLCYDRVFSETSSATTFVRQLECQKAKFANLYVYLSASIFNDQKKMKRIGYREAVASGGF
jgi:hypothetical protein